MTDGKTITLSKARSVFLPEAAGAETGRLYETSHDGNNWHPVTKREFELHKGLAKRRIIISIDPDAA